MIMLTNNRYFQHAKTAALCSPGVGGRTKDTFRLGAVLVERKRVVAASFNSYRTHPLLAKYTEFPFKHAETAVIIKQGLLNCVGLDLYVLRIGRGKPVGLAKPCNICMKWIESAGIARVYYSINEREYGVIRV
jgi:tRNA(Arg) A34 adenosine deaminase TadA